MKPDALIYLEKLESLFGKVDEILKVDTKNTNDPIFVFYFYDLPEKGMLTSITYGLSNVNFHSWTHGRPELIVTLDTMSKDWGFASGYFASEFRGEMGFSYMSMFTTDDPLSDESKMIGYFTFAPSFLNKSQSTIELPTKTIHLIGMYPIYKEEVALLQEIGLKDFMFMPDYDMYSVNRKNLGLK